MTAWKTTLAKIFIFMKLVCRLILVEFRKKYSKRNLPDCICTFTPQDLMNFKKAACSCLVFAPLGWPQFLPYRRLKFDMEVKCLWECVLAAIYFIYYVYIFLLHFFSFLQYLFLFHNYFPLTMCMLCSKNQTSLCVKIPLSINLIQIWARLFVLYICIYLFCNN